MEAAETMSADAIRLYIINSPLVRGQSLNFKDEGVKEVIKSVFLPWFNSFKMLA
jgi:isoleucyl-tRNA synthetase